MTRVLSASRLNDWLGCPHQAALWLGGVRPDETVDPTLELIRKKGFTHEAEVLARLEDKFGKAVRVPGEGPLAERIAATETAMRSGAPLIYQAALAHEQWVGYPDFLVRQDANGDAASYQPEDAKLARKAKAEYILQLGLYAELLHDVAGQKVGNGAVHVSNGPAEPFDLRRTRFILRRLMRKFEAFAADDQRLTRPVPCAACAQCDYKARCEKEWRDADSPFFVAGVSGAKVVKLERAGILTLTQLAHLPDTTEVDGIGPETLAKLAAQAQLQLRFRDSGKHEIAVLPREPGLGFHLLPPSDPADLYFDMEGDPFFKDGLEYLFGLWGPLNGSEATFRAIWAHDHDQEKAAFETLMRLMVEHCGKHPNAHVYHYAGYETTALKRLAMRYATMEAELDHLLRERRFVDLYRVVRQSLRASTEGYSLKDLEKIYWDAREGDVTTAAASIVEYERWCVTGDAAILDAISAYNQHDCLSTARMHRWLEDMRPTGAVYSVPADDATDKVEQSAERAARESRKQALAARVRASRLANADVRDLIAELLWFHQRAQKPGWWALFERQAWTDEELVDDAESLGALTQDHTHPPVPVKKSVDTTYRFPPQDTKLKVGDRPRIAATSQNAGAIIELDPEDGRVVLRRGTKSGPLPDHLSLLTAPIDQQGLPDAVFSFAERFAAGALNSDAALVQFLMRQTPRLRGRVPGAPILAADEDLVAGTIRAAKDLDASYLFVQGPPGTGKTFTISHVILALMEAGHRVGVSSNSHKAIHNVLEEVEKQAAAKRVHFSGVKKATRDRPETEFASSHIETVFSSDEVLSTHRLVAGTAFHYCRDDQRGMYDYLVVDEAGQVALGNLVAMAGAARNLILVGDQMQLPQPVQGVHPGETGLSSLEYLLQDRATVAPHQGILLNQTWRLHPKLCSFVSEAIYDGRLVARPHTADRFLVLNSDAHPALIPAGLSFLSVQHENCTQSSPEEAQAIAALLRNLLTQKVRKSNGTMRDLELKDVLVVAPYNMQVNTLRQVLPVGTKIGTVDKFQGQEAPIVIVSMTTSRGDNAPRGTEFLFNPNRFNVAVSRAQCLAVVVHGSDLLEGSWQRIEDLRRLNLFAHAESIAKS